MFQVATRSPPYLRQLSPRGSTVVPGGSTVVPGGSTVVPGGSTVVPGGSTVIPGGYGVLIMERENCSLASLSWQRYKVPGRELALQR
jgi:hypothetical protein